MPKLARALTSGTAPLFQRLSLSLQGRKIDKAMESVADMLEARARIPGCKRLVCFESFEKDAWHASFSLDARLRLLSALLPSVTALQYFRWNDAFESCFCEVQAQCLTAIDFRLLNYGGGGFSWKLFKAAPALTNVEITCSNYDPYVDKAALQAIIIALRHGLLPNLRQLFLSGCTLKRGASRNLMDALEESGCSKRLATLRLEYCEIGAEEMCALADLLCRGAFPALEYMDLSKNPSIKDVGIVALAEALLNAPETPLRMLDLFNLGMGDKGFAAFAALVHHGRLEKLIDLHLSGDVGVISQGIILLAQAIDARSLPSLKNFGLGYMGIRIQKN